MDLNFEENESSNTLQTVADHIGVVVRTAVVQAEGAAHIAAAVHIVAVADCTGAAVHIEDFETAHTVADPAAYHNLPSAVVPWRHPFDCHIHRNSLVACWKPPLLRGLPS